MAKLLLLETATNICSVGISDNGVLLVEKKAEEDYAHARMITLLIKACLSAANLKLRDLDAIAISSGPGSFTSLRVGTATAKGICYALGLPLIVVSTLQSLAAATSKMAKNSPYIFAPSIDARRQEVYIQLFNDQLEPITELEAMILNENSFQDHRQAGLHILASGNGAAKMVDIVGDPLIVNTELFCSASYLVNAAEKSFQEENFVDIAYYEPLYLKPPNITKPSKLSE